jgi:methionyl aminopeptidase
MIGDASKPWVQLLQLEKMSQLYLDKYDLKGSFKGYGGFPANLCLSNNDCVVHGIPDSTVLQDGDVLKIDVWVTYKWCIADAAITVVVWWEDKNPLWADLIKNTKRSLDLGIKELQPYQNGLKFSQTVYNTMRKWGYNVIKTLTGHGVGQEVHEWPAMYNYPEKSMKKVLLRPGMVIALEPITAVKSDNYIEWSNGWNLYTEQGDLWAQWEYTLAITDNGIEVLAGVQ